MPCFYHVFRELNRLCFHTQALDCMACTASRINGYFRRSPAQITHAPPDLLIGNHLLGMWLLCIPCIWPFETCIRWLQLGQVFYSFGPCSQSCNASCSALLLLMELSRLVLHVVGELWWVGIDPFIILRSLFAMYVCVRHKRRPPWAYKWPLCGPYRSKQVQLLLTPPNRPKCRHHKLSVHVLTCTGVVHTAEINCPFQFFLDQLRLYGYAISSTL